MTVLALASILLKGLASLLAIGMGVILVAEVEADGSPTTRAAWLYGAAVLVVLWGIWI